MKIAFKLLEYDLEKPWIMLRSTRHQLEVHDEAEFEAQTSARWPAPRYEIQRDRPRSDWWESVTRPE